MNMSRFLFYQNQKKLVTAARLTKSMTNIPTRNIGMMQRISTYLPYSFKTEKHRVLSKNTNQARGLAQYAIDFLNQNQNISESVYEKTKLLHADSCVCAIAALALKAHAPTILRNSALNFYSNFDTKPKGVRVAKVFGSNVYTNVEKAISANVSATNELNANGFSIGYFYDDYRNVYSGEINFNR